MIPLILFNKFKFNENFLTKSTKISVLLAMVQGPTRFEHLQKSIDDYIIEHQNKNTRAKTTRDVKLVTEISERKTPPKKSRGHRSRRTERISLRIYT